MAGGSSEGNKLQPSPRPRRPASSNASEMRSATGVGRRAMGKIGTSAPCLHIGRIWPRSHARERERGQPINAPTARHCLHAGRGRDNAYEYQALLNCGWPPVSWRPPGGTFDARLHASVAMNLSAGASISRETSSVSTRRCWLTRGLLPTIRANIVEAR
jgi:hypothetical protein